MNRETEIWVEWMDVFGPNNEPVYCRISRNTAIAVANATHPTRYKNDEEALQDFMVTHWAQIINIMIDDKGTRFITHDPTSELHAAQVQINALLQVRACVDKVIEEFTKK